MKFYLLIVSFLLTFLANSQEFKAVHVKETTKSISELTRFNNYYYAVDFDWQGLSGFSANLKRFIQSLEIKQYDNELNEIKTVKVSGGEKLYGPIEPAVRIINGELCLIYFKKGKGDVNKMLLSKINPETLEITAPLEILHIEVSEGDLKFYLRSIGDNDKNRSIVKDYNYLGASGFTKTLFIESSPDQSRHLAIWNSGWDKNVAFSVLDNNYKILRSGIINLKDYDNLRLRSAIIDNTGNMYIAIGHETRGEHQAMIYIHTAEGKEIKKPITVPQSEPFGIQAALNSKNPNTVFITGFYREGKRYLTGLYAMTLDTKSLAISQPVTTPFPEDIVTIADKERWGNTKQKDFGLSDNLFLELLPLSNGGFDVLSDFRGSITYEKSSVFYSGSIIYAKFNNTTKANFTRIPRLIAERNRVMQAPVGFFEYQGKPVVLYNDHLKNISQDIKEKAYSSKLDDKVAFIAAIINEDGSVTRKVIINEGSRRFIINPNHMLINSPNSFVMRFERREAVNTKWEFSSKWELVTLE